MSENHLPKSWIFAYSAPVLPMTALHAPALSILPGIYAKYAGIDLAVLGTILVLSRLIDVFTDPLIGFLSDRTTGRAGPRKPWIVGGGLIVMLACWFWFRPGPDTGATYFLVASVAVYIGWTMVEIPHAAWLGELAPGYEQRSRLASFRTMSYYGGFIVFFGVPFLPLFPSTEFTPQTTAFTSWIIIGLLAVSLIFLVRVLPSKVAQITEQPKLKEVVRALSANRPFVIFFFGLLCTGLASGMTAGLFFFFMDSYLDISDKIAHVGLAAFVISLCATQLWPPIMNRFGKHVTLALSGVGTICALGLMATIQPGSNAYPMMLTVFILSAITGSGVPICILAIMADVVDYDELKTGKRKAASYFSFLTILEKAGIAIGAGLGLIIAGYFGFEVAGINDQRAVAGFFVAFLGIPITLHLLGIILLLNFPIDARRHSIIRRRLDSLAQRQSRT